MMAGMFVNEIPDLFFCHFPKKPMYKIIIGEMCIFFHKAHPFLFFCCYISIDFFYFKFRSSGRIFLNFNLLLFFFRALSCCGRRPLVLPRYKSYTKGENLHQRRCLYKKERLIVLCRQIICG